MSTDKIPELLSQPQFAGPVAAAHLRGMITFASQAIHGAFAVNVLGGIAAFVHYTDRGSPLILCALGAIAAIFAAGCAWKAQQFYADAEIVLFAGFDSATETCYRRRQRGKLWTRICAAFCILSIALFLGAMVVATLVAECR